MQEGKSERDKKTSEGKEHLVHGAPDKWRHAFRADEDCG